MNPIRTPLTGLFVIVIVSLLSAAPAHAKVDREITENSTPSGLMIVSPNRFEEDVEPGVRKTLEVEVFNDSDKTIDITVRPTDFGESDNPRSVGAQTEDGEFGAGDWITSEVTDDRLKPFERITFTVIIDPPADAAIGTSLAGIAVKGAPGTGKIGATDGESFVAIEALIQAFFTVPGPVEHKLTIVSVEARDTVVIGSQRFVVWDVKYRNDGTVNEHVKGTFTVKSLFGNTAYREPIKDFLVLRGATRTSRYIWRDLPWVGGFHPEVRVRGDDAKLQEASGDRVWIMPWWLPVLLIVSIVFPFVFLWWRRRQDWRQYLDEEEWDDETSIS